MKHKNRYILVEESFDRDQYPQKPFSRNILGEYESVGDALRNASIELNDAMAEPGQSFFTNENRYVYDGVRIIATIVFDDGVFPITRYTIYGVTKVS